LGFFPQRYGCQQDESFGELWILGLKEALVFFYCQPEVAKLPQEVSVLEYLDTSHTVDEKMGGRNAIRQRYKDSVSSRPC
jgi:hypothetical protein